MNTSGRSLYARNGGSRTGRGGAGNWTMRLARSIRQTSISSASTAIIHLRGADGRGAADQVAAVRALGPTIAVAGVPQSPRPPAACSAPWPGRLSAHKPKPICALAASPAVSIGPHCVTTQQPGTASTDRAPREVRRHPQAAVIDPAGHVTGIQRTCSTGSTRTRRRSPTCAALSAIWSATACASAPLSLPPRKRGHDCRRWCIGDDARACNLRCPCCRWLQLSQPLGRPRPLVQLRRLYVARDDDAASRFQAAKLLDERGGAAGIDVRDLVRRSTAISTPISAASAPRRCSRDLRSAARLGDLAFRTCRGTAPAGVNCRPVSCRNEERLPRRPCRRMPGLRKRGAAPGLPERRICRSRNGSQWRTPTIFRRRLWGGFAARSKMLDVRHPPLRCGPALHRARAMGTRLRVRPVPASPGPP